MSLGGFLWIREGALAIAGRPRGVADLMWMREQGIRAVVSLTLDPLAPSELDECDLAGLHLPIPDFQPPTLAQIQTFDAFTRDQRTCDHAVLVHCGSGVGRSGTLAACFLVTVEGLEADEALAEVRRRRAGAVETPEQEVAIQQWADHLRTRSTDSE